MITLRMAKWPDDTGIKHVGTIWQIATDYKFSHIIDATDIDKVYLDIFYSNVVIPKDKVYYGRSKRIFDVDTESEWIGPVKLLPSNAGSTIDIKPDVSIDVPYVYISEDDINDVKKDTIEIATSGFRCNNDGHKATSWVVRNKVGKVLYTDMYSSKNKLSLQLDKKSISLDNLNGIMVEANHISSNDFESSFGFGFIDLTDYKFEVISNLHSVSPNKDFKLELASIADCTDKYPLEYIEVYDQNNRLIYERVLKDDRVITVDRELLRSGSSYTARLYINREFNEFKDIYFNTSLNSGSFITDPQYTYREELVKTNMLISGVRAVVSEQLVDNGIPIPVKNKGSLVIYNYDRRKMKISPSGLPYSFLTNDIDIKEGVNVAVIDSNFVIVDQTYVGVGYPTFNIYDYDSQKLVKSIKRKDELSNTGISNNLAIKHVDDDNVLLFYFAKTKDGVVFKSLNLITDEVTVLTNRPDISGSEANLVNINNGKLMSFGTGLKNQIYTYDINDKEWHSVTLLPETFRNISTASYLRKDGKVISFNLGNGTNDTMLFDPADNTVKLLKNDVDDTIDLDSVVRLRNGEFIRYDSKLDISRVYIYK